MMLGRHHRSLLGTSAPSCLTVLGFTWLCGTVSHLFVVPAATLESPPPHQQEQRVIDLQAPHSVKVEAQSEHSFTLSWQAPDLPADSARPTGYSVYYSRMPKVATAQENEVTVSSSNLQALVSNLKPGTNYSVRVAARYQGNQSASFSLPFIVSTLVLDNAIERSNADLDCDCYAQGTVRCVQALSATDESNCVCNAGYRGPKCDVCTAGHFMTGNQCVPCNCPRQTSSGTCLANIELKRGRECGCLPGHQGADCNTCAGDHFWYVDQCLHCNCLVLCPMNKGYQHCHNCELILNATRDGLEICSTFNSHLLQHRSKKPSDGTVAIIAVLLSITFIASVATGLWCYRNKCQNQTEHSLWSMELHEEKVSLNSSCDYQRLDAAAIGVRQDAAAAKKQRMRPATAATMAHQQNGLKAEGNHKYHCISI